MKHSGGWLHRRHTGNCQNNGNTWVNEGHKESIESKCFHTGVVPELSNSHPIMLRAMHRNAGQTIIVCQYFGHHDYRMKMPPSTGHKWKSKWMVCSAWKRCKPYAIPISGQISTQLNTYGRFWSVAWYSVFHHHQQNTKLWNFLWKNGVVSLQ